MCYGSCKFDVAHTLTTNFCTGNFDTASLADNSFEAYALVLTAIALPVTSWSEDLFIKKTILFWLEGSVVNGFWLLDLTKRPLTNIVSGGKTDS